MQNLTKKEKLILSILSALFIAPELVWGMISKYWFYTLLGTRFDVNAHVLFIADPKNSKFYTNILFLQFFGLLGLLIFVIIKRKKIKSPNLFITLSSVLLILTSVVLAFGYALSYVTYSIGF